MDGALKRDDVLAIRRNLELGGFAARVYRGAQAKKWGFNPSRTVVVLNMEPTGRMNAETFNRVAQLVREIEPESSVGIAWIIPGKETYELPLFGSPEVTA